MESRVGVRICFLPYYKQMPCQSDFDTAILTNTDKMAVFFTHLLKIACGCSKRLRLEDRAEPLKITLFEDRAKPLKIGTECLEVLRVSVSERSSSAALAKRSSSECNERSSSECNERSSSTIGAIYFTKNRRLMMFLAFWVRSSLSHDNGLSVQRCGWVVIMIQGGKLPCSAAWMISLVE